MNIYRSKTDLFIGFLISLFLLLGYQFSKCILYYYFRCTDCSISGTLEKRKEKNLLHIKWLLV